MPYAGLNLEGMTALVTGSGRGIGSALAIGLAQAGANVAVSDVPEQLPGAHGRGCNRPSLYPGCSGLG